MRTSKTAPKAVLLASIAASTLMMSGAAYAQAAAAAADEDNNIIIVTASKRTATLQDTPISVSVTGRQQIEQSQVRDIKDLQTLVPSLRVSQLQSSANTNFIIRGFGNGANNAGIEPSVGVFIDGVYRSRSAAQIGDLPNLERVEVLRGPQSTLFGKNASAGIISIVTREPQFDLGGNAEFSYGNYNAVILRGGVTGPITDKIAFSIDGNLNKRDGYAFDVVRNVKVTDRDRWGVRGSLLFKPNDDLKIRLIADYDKIDEDCCITANVVDGVTGGIVRALGGRVISNQPFAFQTATNFGSTTKVENYGVSGQLDWNASDTLALTSITAYRRVNVDSNQDSDFTSADIIGNNEAHTRIKTFTQELRLASSFDGPLNFLIGGFYFNEKIDIDSNLLLGKDARNFLNGLAQGQLIPNEPTIRALNPGLPAGPFYGQGQGAFEKYDYKNTAYSIFGQVDFEPVEGLVFTAGGNYTNDRKDVITNNRITEVFGQVDLIQTAANAGIPGQIPLPTGTIFPRTTACTPTTPAGFCNPFLPLAGLQFLRQFLNYPNAVEDGKTRDSKFTYTLRAAYKLNDDLSTYVTYATGFKASSVNLSRDSRPLASQFIPGSPAQVPAPAPSAIRTAGLALPNLTTGTRSSDPENAEVYEIGLKGQYEGFAFNVAVFKQILKGFQGNFFVGSGFVLTNAEKQSVTGVELDTSMSPIKNFTVTANFTYLNPKFDSFPNGVALSPVTLTTLPFNLTGVKPSGISEFTYSIGATYSADLNEDMRATFHVDYFGVSPTQIANNLLLRRADESLNASITLGVGRGFEFTLWGRNLTDAKYLTAVFEGVIQPGSLNGYPSQPRTYGGLVRYRF